jgi:hypothetical protein
MTTSGTRVEPKKAPAPHLSRDGVMRLIRHKHPGLRFCQRAHRTAEGPRAVIVDAPHGTPLAAAGNAEPAGVAVGAPDSWWARIPASGALGVLRLDPQRGQRRLRLGVGESLP